MTEGAADPTGVWSLVSDSAEEAYEHAPCGYLSTLPDGTIVKANQTLLRWIGHEHDALVGHVRFQSLLAPGDRIFYETHYAPLLAMQGSVREIAVELVRADGTRLPALVNAAVVHDADGRPALVRTTVFDATERRSYERELLQARRRAEESEARARALARVLQSSFIPPEPPAVPGLEVGAVYRPAGQGDEVGGDFYDIFPDGSGDWAVVLGDVCGKGAEAAAVTALARYTVRAAAMRLRRPSAVLSRLNEALLRQGSDRFCTVVYARVRATPEGRRLTLACGGHPLPIKVTARGQARAVGRSGALLGVLGDPALPDASTELRPGDAIALFTDGVPEARRGRDFFGEQRLAALLVGYRHLAAGELAQRVVDEVVEFQAGTTRDDIALVVLKVPAA